MVSSKRTTDLLDDECRVFCRYLIRQMPGTYVYQKYRVGNRASNLDPTNEQGRFGSLLVGLASAHPSLTKLADTYARIFAPRSVLRKKLVLLLAILESSAPTHHYFDSVDASGKTGFLTGLILRAPLFLLTLALSTVVLLPLQLLFGGLSQSQPKGETHA